MKPTAWASSCRAAVDPSRGPTTKAAAFIGRHSDRISCIPGSKSSHRIVNKWLWRVPDLAVEQRCVGLEQGDDPLDHEPHLPGMALVLMGDEPLLLQQFVDRRCDANEAGVAVARKAREHREPAAGGDELDHRMHVV